MFLVVFYGFFCLGELMVKGVNLRLFVYFEDFSFLLYYSCVILVLIVIMGFKYDISGCFFLVNLVSVEYVEFCLVNYLR